MGPALIARIVDAESRGESGGSRDDFLRGGRAPTQGSDRAFARWTARLTFAYRPRLGATGTDQDAPGGSAMGESQAAQLIVFVLATTGLLVALEVGLRRAHRRR